MARLWTLAVIAERFHVLPSQVARDLDNDPEQSALLCSGLLRYAECKHDFASCSKHAMERWEGSHELEVLKEIEEALVEEERAKGA